MNCSACGTRVGSDIKNCPNCGRTMGKSSSSTGASESSMGSSKLRGLSPSSAQPSDSGDASVDSAGRGRQNKKQSPSESKVREVSLETPAEEPRGSSATGSHVSTPKIRELIHDRPDSLEEGLSIYTDSDAEPVGINFDTDVGMIDLLARDDAGGLVVVLIAPESEPGSDGHGKELVSEALERVGWVRKHVAKPKQEVRSIVLLEQVPDDIRYTAAAVATTVAFKTYRMRISFRDVEL